MDEEIFFSSAYKGSKNFTQQHVPVANATGFGAAADDYMERGIDLNEQLIMNKPATFFFQMNSHAMSGAGIQSGDILIVDRSVKATNGKIIVAAVDGELIVRRLSQTINRVILLPENRQFKDVIIEEFTTYQPWGVVTCAIHVIEKGLLAENKNNLNQQPAGLEAAAGIFKKQTDVYTTNH